MTKHNKVVIIGAGTSGLAVGTRLIEHGIQDFVILEAENRYGGRVYSQPFGGYKVDLGAQWCHGENGNVVFEKANGLGMLEHSTGQEADLAQALVCFDGIVVSKSLHRRIANVFGKITANIDVEQDQFPTLEEYFKTKLQEEIVKKENQDIPQHVLQAAQKAFPNLAGVRSIFDNYSLASMKDPWHCCEGDFMINWKQNTYGSFLDVLIRPNNDVTRKTWTREKILLEKVVRKIDWNTRPVRISCEDGSEFTADYLITTVSLGVLKHYPDLFVPKLPPSKINAIENLNMGYIGKFYFTFPKVWWSGSITNGAKFIYEDSEVDQLLEKFDGTKNENSWLLNVTGFNVVENKPGILQSWIFGDACQHAERLPDSVVKNKLMQLFRIFIKDRDIPEPTDFKRTMWSTHPHYYGAISWSGTNTQKANASASDLAEPIEKDGIAVLLFAGEATHPNHYQTVHGAIESGYREADRVYRFLDENHSHKKL